MPPGALESFGEVAPPESQFEPPVLAGAEHRQSIEAKPPWVRHAERLGGKDDNARVLDDGMQEAKHPQVVGTMMERFVENCRVVLVRWLEVEHVTYDDIQMGVA